MYLLLEMQIKRKKKKETNIQAGNELYAKLNFQLFSNKSSIFIYPSRSLEKRLFSFNMWYDFIGKEFPGASPTISLSLKYIFPKSLFVTFNDIILLPETLWLVFLQLCLPRQTIWPHISLTECYSKEKNEPKTPNWLSLALPSWLYGSHKYIA